MISRHRISRRHTAVDATDGYGSLPMSSLRRVRAVTAPTTCTSGSASTIPTSTARGCSTPPSCGRTTCASTGAGARASSTSRAPSSQQGCCSYGAHFVDAADVDERRAVTSSGSAPNTCSSTPTLSRTGSPCPVSSTTTANPPSSADSSTTPASSSTAPDSRAASAVRCTSPPRRPASARSTGSRRCAGRCRSASNTPRTSRATSRHGCGSGSDATGAKVATSSAWWCTETPDAFVGSEPFYVSARDDIVELVGPHIYDLMVEVFERPVCGAAAAPGVAPDGRRLISRRRPRRRRRRT